MKRASEVKVAGQWNAAEAVDRVVLDAGDRQRRRIVLTGCVTRARQPTLYIGHPHLGIEAAITMVLQ
jgi:hypothetical protein